MKEKMKEKLNKSLIRRIQKFISFFKNNFNLNLRYQKYKRYKLDKYNYEKLNTRESFNINRKIEWSITTEWDKQAGSLGCYFWQDLWAARHIHYHNPKTHYDIGSRIDGFIAHVCSFRSNVVLIDVRPLDKKIDGLGFIQADAKNLENIENSSISSLSSLYAIEHFGLGRYGDEIDPEGSFKALKEIERVICKDGYFYLSVPIGKECLEFNAHRIFYPSTIIGEMKEMELIEFSTIDSMLDEIQYNDNIHHYDEIFTEGKVFGLFKFRKL